MRAWGRHEAAALSTAHRAALAALEASVNGRREAQRQALNAACDAQRAAALGLIKVKERGVAVLSLSFSSQAFTNFEPHKALVCKHGLTLSRMALAWLGSACRG